jgi:hypothetical protein
MQYSPHPSVRNSVIVWRNAVLHLPSRRVSHVEEVRLRKWGRAPHSCKGRWMNQEWIGPKELGGEGGNKIIRNIFLNVKEKIRQYNLKNPVG